MRLPDPLIPGLLLARRQRFLADVLLPSGETVTAHCANSGSMSGLAEKGAEVLLSRATTPGRKLAWTWELVRREESWVMINTSRTNGLVREAWEKGLLPFLAPYPLIQPEVTVAAGSRLDFLFHGGEEPRCLCEVKSVTLRLGDQVAFPDAVTERGKRHLYRLMAAREEGYRSMILFCVAREDGLLFRPAREIDPEYAATLLAAHRAGVEIHAWQCRILPPEITLSHPLPIEALDS